MVRNADSTLSRRIVARALLVGPESTGLRTVAKTFMRHMISIEQAKTAALAGNELAVLMPQVVVVLTQLREEERAALVDRVTAVGALLIHVDPTLDEETVKDLAERAAAAAIDRKKRRDDSQPDGPASEPPPAEEVDDGWK